MPTELASSPSHLLNEKDAQELLVRLVRAEMAQRGIGYRELGAALAEIGVEIDERALRNKVARGTFSAAFLLQLCRALKMESFPSAVRTAQAYGPDVETLRAALQAMTPEQRKSFLTVPK